MAAADHVAATTSSTSDASAGSNAMLTTASRRNRANVAQSWASWRQEQSERKSCSPSTLEQSRSVQQQQHSSPRNANNVCSLVKNLWSSLLLLHPRKPKTNHHRVSSKKRTSSTTSLRTFSTRPQEQFFFESVTRHFVAKTISCQVVNYYQEEGIQLLNYLPSDYDFDKAMESICASRKRAFMLLDLAAICKAHVELQQLLGSKVKLQYNVGLNRNVALLELLSRLQVQFRCNSNQDVKVLRDLLSNHNQMVVDHASCTRKPNGYLKRIAKYTNTFTVEGPEEVYRIKQTLVGKHHVGYMLRLPRDLSKWKESIQQTQRAALVQEDELDGISVSLEHYLEENGKDLDLLQECVALALANSPRGKFCVDVSGFDKLSTASIQEFFQQLQTLVQVFQNDSEIIVTADVSHLLVAHAGALCTRINGVKRVVRVNVDSEQEECMHYYIDDGCYGSLQKNGSLPGVEFSPMPLKTNENDTNDDAFDANELVSSTVWGPTCDGLDRVCRQVMLPRLKRNDWLVFPNLGCGGFGGGLGYGTSFNGFEPPDTAYCVLGYFGKQQE